MISTKGGEAYLDALTDLIESYEAENERFPQPSPDAVLRELINSSGQGQHQLSKAVGIAQSTISAIANGIREPTTDQWIRFAKHFGVSPTIFLAADKDEAPRQGGA